MGFSHHKNVKYHIWYQKLNTTNKPHAPNIRVCNSILDSSKLCLKASEKLVGCPFFLTLYPKLFHILLPVNFFWVEWELVEKVFDAAQPLDSCV